MSKIDNKIAKLAAALPGQKLAAIQQSVDAQKSGALECVNWQCSPMGAGGYPLRMISYKD